MQRARGAVSEISLRAAPASMSYCWQQARSPRESIPTTLSPSITGRRRTCWAAILRAAS